MLKKADLGPTTHILVATAPGLFRIRWHQLFLLTFCLAHEPSHRDLREVCIRGAVLEDRTVSQVPTVTNPYLRHMP